MARVFIIIVVVFLLPFLLYRASLSVLGKDKNGVNWFSAPLGTLAFLGAILSVATVVILTLWSQGDLDLSWLGL